MDDLPRLKQLKDQSFLCSQILIMQGLQAQGKDNPCAELTQATSQKVRELLAAGGFDLSGGRDE